MNRSALLFLALVVPGIAAATETGEIRGSVLDPAGAPAVGVDVVLSGSSIAGEIVVTTGEDGGFRFVSVPPGVHKVDFIGAGYELVTTQVTVVLNQSTWVPVTLSPETEGVEVISIETTLPVIDATSSSFSASLGTELLQNLPVGRSYQDAVTMLPGVYGRIDTSSGGPSDGNPSVRGEGQYGNNYMVDGVSTRDPATKTFGSNVNFDAIEDIQVYTDGAPAEYGQFAGMIVNVVTKDGGDEHHGSLGYWLNTDASFGTYDIADLGAHEEVPTSKRDFLAHSVSATAGGPLVPEKLWYFGAVNFGVDRAVYEGMNPETPYQGNNADGFVKLSWFATPDFTVRGILNFGGSRIDNNETSSQILPEAQSQRRDSTMAPQLRATWHPDASTEVEVFTGYWQNEINVVPQSGLTDVPSITNLDNGQVTKNWTDSDFNKRRRLGGGLTATRVVYGFLGDHKLKAGAEVWFVRDSRDLQYTGPGEGAEYYASAESGFPCEAADFSDCLRKTEYKRVGALPHTGQLFTAFIQDDWTIGKRLTLNLGARLDRESLMQNEGKPVTMDDPDTVDIVEEKAYQMLMPAPRVGVAWDVTGDSKTLVSAFGGQYYDVVGNSFADWADTRSAYDFTESCNVQDPACAVLGVDDDNDGWFVTHHQDPTGNPLIYSTRLKPARMDKITVGIERELVKDFSLGLHGILSQTVNIPEDVNHDDANWFVEPSPFKKRDYKGIEITAEKKFNDRWQLLAAWTLSTAKGNTPGQFETASGGDTGSDGNNVGVYMDDVGDQAVRDFYMENGYGWVLDGLSGLGHRGDIVDADGNKTGELVDQAGWYGYLPYHSFHQVKINGSYTFTDGTTLGLVYEFDSGHAWQRRTNVWLYGDYFGFGEGRGTRFMPPVNYIDVRLAHTFELDEEEEGRKLELTLDVFNLPDFKTPVTYYENDDANFGLTLYRQAPRAVRAGIRMTY